MEQDAFHQDRLLIEHCTFSIDNMEELKNVLINSVIYNLHEDHYFNVRLWIPVLNVLDDALLTLLKWMFRESDGIQNDEWYKALVPGSAEHIQYFEVKSLLEVIISWTSKLISHSYNNNVYNSAEVIMVLFLV